MLSQKSTINIKLPSFDICSSWNVSKMNTVSIVPALPTQNFHITNSLYSSKYHFNKASKQSSFYPPCFHTFIRTKENVSPFFITINTATFKSQLSGIHLSYEWKSSSFTSVLPFAAGQCTQHANKHCDLT